MGGERILVVEDERIVTLDIKSTLSRLGYQVADTAAEGADAVAKAGRLRPDLVLMDVRLQGEMDGIEAARHIQRLYDIPIIYLTAYSDPETLERAKSSGPFGYLLKPFEEREVHSAIELAVYKHQVEQNMRQAKAAAEAANDAKTSFLGTVSHELRTPMNGIIGMTELLLMTEMSTEQLEYARLIKDSSLKLLSVLNDILDYSRIEARSLKLHHTPFNLSQVMDAAVSPWRSQADAKGLYTDIFFAEDLPMDMEGDAGRLKQTLSNLVHNAVKFTDKGGVRIEAESFGEEADPSGNGSPQTRLHIVVADTGPGLSSEQAELAFESFTQGEDYMTRNQGGLGLGLSISRRLVELLGGRLWLESSPGQGASFHFTALVGLQPPKAPKETKTEASAVDLSGVRILVAEDNHTSRTLAVRLLSQHGAEVTAVDDGQQALEALSASPHDLVLMDIQMPVMDGIQTTRRIRSGELDKVKPNIPIIAITAHAMKGDAQRCLEAGMNRYLSKPLDVSQLVATIAEVLDLADEAPSMEGPPLVDVQACLIRMANDEELFLDILDAFLADAPMREEELRQAFDSGDEELIRRTNHTLRGAAVNIGAIRLVNASRELSSALQEPQGRDVTPLRGQLLETLAQTMQWIREHLAKTRP